MSRVDIAAVREVDHDLLEAVRKLLGQLSTSAKPLTAETLAAIIACPTTELFVARARTEPHDILGMLTLVTFRISSGLRAWIEDVVVDHTARGTGIGEALIRAAVARAHAVGARTVELTSRPSRDAANRLYRKLGFELRDTNVYRLALGQTGP